MGPSFPRLNNDTGSPTLSDNVFGEDLGDGVPNISPRPVIDLGDSAPPLPPRLGLINTPHNLDSNKLFVPIKKRRAPSPPGLDRSRGGANSLLINRVTHLANTQQRLVDKYVLDQRPVSAPDSFRFNHSEDQSVNVETNILITADSGARPKVSQSSNLVFLDKNFTDKNITESSDFTEPPMQGDGDVAINDVYRLEGMRSRVSADSGVDSAHLLEPETTDDLKPSERQSSNLDEAHLSTALSMFDPLTTNTENAGDLLEGAASPPPPVLLQSFTSQPSNIATEPLICVTNGGEPPGLFKPINNGEDSTQFEFPLQSSTKPNQIGVMDNGSAVYLGGGASANKRRGSSDSSHSSSSNLSKEGSGRMEKPEALDTGAQNSEERVSGTTY